MLCNIISERTPEIAEQRTPKLAFQSLCDFMLFIFIHSNFHVIRTLSYDCSLFVFFSFSPIHLRINKDFSHSTVSSFLSLKLVKLAGSGPVQFQFIIPSPTKLRGDIVTLPSVTILVNTLGSTSFNGF